MPALIIYLLKVNAALCLFYIAYRLALRPLTFYYLNRFFLVFGIVFSTVYPLVDISSLFAAHTVIRRQLTPFVPDWHAVLPAVQHQAQTINYWGVPVAIFWLGVILMAMRLAAQFISLYRIHRQSAQSSYYGHSFRSVRSEVNPFSFWQEIYLNPDKHTDAELRSIIQHEQVHVKQWHTLDVILAELSVVFYWFNPGVWFMKQAVKENLEFITDREILRSGIDEKVYQYSLVRVGALKPSTAIVNNFNFLTIKKRIIMMNKKRSSKAQLTKYVVLLPLVMLLALIFTVSKAELTNKSITKLVKKMLPVSITFKPAPVKAVTPVKITGDTVKPKIKRDTAINYTVIRVNDGDNVQNDTLVTDGKGKKMAKTIRVVRINGKDEDNKNVIVLDGDGKPANVSVDNVSPDDIESIQIVGKDSLTQSLNLHVVPGKQLVLRLKPTANLSSFSTGLSTNVTTNTVSTTNVTGVATTGKKYLGHFNVELHNTDDQLVYVIDPKNINPSEIENMRKTFKNNGFDMSVRQDYSGKTLKGLYVKINYEGKNSASSSYSNDDMSKVDYVIKVIGDKKTGEVSIAAIK